MFEWLYEEAHGWEGVAASCSRHFLDTFCSQVPPPLPSPPFHVFRSRSDWAKHGVNIHARLKELTHGLWCHKIEPKFYGADVFGKSSMCICKIMMSKVKMNACHGDDVSDKGVQHLYSNQTGVSSQSSFWATCPQWYVSWIAASGSILQGRRRGRKVYSIQVYINT